MRAAVITTLAGPAGVEVREMPEPSTSSGDVLIDVAYAGVSFPDLLQTRGEYQQRPDLPFIPGWEVAGIVRADVGRFRAGDRVAAMPMLGFLRRFRPEFEAHIKQGKCPLGGRWH